MTDDRAYVYDETNPIEHSERDVLHYHTPPPDINTYLVQLPDSTPELAPPPQQQAPRSRETTIVNTYNIPDTEEEENDPLQSYIRKNLSCFRKSLTAEDFHVNSMYSPTHDDSVVVTPLDPREVRTDELSHDNHKETKHSKADLENKVQVMPAISDHMFDNNKFSITGDRNLRQLSKDNVAMMISDEDLDKFVNTKKKHLKQNNDVAKPPRAAFKEKRDQRQGKVSRVRKENIEGEEHIWETNGPPKNEWTVMTANVDSSKSSPFKSKYLDVDNRPSSRVRVMIMIDSSDDHLKERRYSNIGKDSKVYTHKNGSGSSDGNKEQSRGKLIYDQNKEDNIGRTCSPKRHERHVDVQKPQYKGRDERTKYYRDKQGSPKPHHRDHQYSQDGGEYYDRNADVITKPTDVQKQHHKDHRLPRDSSDETSKHPSRGDSKRKRSPVDELASKVRDNGANARKGKIRFSSDGQGQTLGKDKGQFDTKDQPAERYDKNGADGKPRPRNKRTAEDDYRKYTDKDAKSDSYGSGKTPYLYKKYDKDFDPSKQSEKREHGREIAKDAKRDKYGDDKTPYPNNIYDKDYDRPKQPKKRDLDRDKRFSSSGRLKEGGGREGQDPYNDRVYPYYESPDKNTGKDPSKQPDTDKSLQYITVKAPKSATKMVAKKRYHIQIPEHGQPETWFNARFNVTDENNVDMNYEGPVKINNYYSSNKYL